MELDCYRCWFLGVHSFRSGWVFSCFLSRGFISLSVFFLVFLSLTVGLLLLLLSSVPVLSSSSFRRNTVFSTNFLPDHHVLSHTHRPLLKIEMSEECFLSLQDLICLSLHLEFLRTFQIGRYLILTYLPRRSSCFPPILLPNLPHSHSLPPPSPNSQQPFLPLPFP